jgi:hypothetical protein
MDEKIIRFPKPRQPVERAASQRLSRGLASIGTPASREDWRKAQAAQEAEELANRLPVMTVFPTYD